MKRLSSPRAPTGSPFARSLQALRNAAARLSVFALLSLGATSALFAPQALAASSNFIVNTGTTDLVDASPGNGVCADANGQCSLRAAINEANALQNTLVGGIPTPHAITFSVAIVNIINGSLPTLMAPVTITGTPVLTTIISGNNSGAGSKLGCFDLTDSGTVALNHGSGASGSTIANLTIGNCGGSGISANGHDYKFLNNRIGVDPTGLIATPNVLHGISVSASQVYPDTSTGFFSNIYNSIATPFPAIPVDASQINAFQSNLATALASLKPVLISGNVISGNTLNGIEIFSQNLAAVTVVNNKIGTDLTGNLAIPNGGSGIRLSGDTFGHLIGPNNVISGNTGDGIRIESDTVFLPNFIMGNRIGLAATDPTAHIGNGLNGISASTKPSTDPLKFNPAMISLVIGPANLISDNKGGSNSADPDVMGVDNAGILLTGQANAVKVVGNSIGIGDFVPGSPVASKSYGNAGDGIIVTSSGNSIGGSTVGTSNNIAGNARHGIVVRGSATTSTSLLGNSIGVHSGLAGNLSIGNGVDGIHIDNASSTSIGGTGATDLNVVAGNGRNGIKLVNGGAQNGWSNLFQRNQIYSNAKLLAGVGIDLDRTQNATNDSTGEEFPNTHANLDQNAPHICTGAADTGACAGSTAPSSTGSNTSLNWAITTHGPADFRAEFFRINAASSNAATSMTFIGEQLFTTSAAGVPVTSGCAAGRCTVTLATGALGSSILMTVTDITPITDTPTNGGDWKGQLKCFAGNLGVILATCNVNNTSEYSNAFAIPLSSNANLSALTVSSGTLVPVFASGTSVYADSVANAVTSMTVTPTVAQANATIKVNGNTVGSGSASGAIALAVGANAIPVIVTAQDGTTTQTYAVNVTRAAAISNNANLGALTISSGTLVPVFASGTFVYADAVANAVSTITVTPTVANATATVKVNGNTVVSGSASGAIALAVGANAITVIVTAQDAITTQTYSVDVTRAAPALSSNANLSALAVSAGILTPAFVSATFSYTDSVANAVTSITVTPTVADATATVKVNGNTVVSGSASAAIALAVGANPITVIVTAQDGTTTQSYTVNVTRAAAALSSNANLSALAVSSGSLVPAFASATLAYTDAVANAVSSITVTPTVADATATIKVNGTTVASGSASGAIALAVGANAITVLVTAQDGTTTQTHTVNVNRAGALSNNASLSALTVSSGSLVPAFASATLIYADAVANAVTSITVTPTVAQANATIKVNGNTVASGSASAAIALAVGANAISVVVTAQDGTTTQTYTVNVNRAGALSNNADLSALAISSGSLVPAFASATLVYSNAVANGVSSITVTPTVADATATVKVNAVTVASGSASGAIALAVGANGITVVVTAQDGTTTQTYTVNVNRAGAPSNDASLSALTVSSGSLVPLFASGTLIYADAVANAVTSITVTPTVTQANATIKVNGITVASGSASAAIALAVGANAITVVVTAQDGTSMQTYTVNVNRAGALSNNASLSALTVSGGTLSPAFATATLAYTDAVANAVTSIRVTPTVADATATVKVNGVTVASGSASAAIALAVGSNTVTIVVTAQDGTTTQTYTVNVTRAAPVVTVFSGTTSTGTGVATATLSGGGATCTFGTTAFVGPSAPAPAGVTFPDGLFDFTTTNCTGTITVTVVFPTTFAAGAQYWKYGPTPSLSSPHWYTLAAGAPNNLVLSGKTATFTITDGGIGDDDLTVNGTIVDRGGIGIAAAVTATDPVTVPTLSQWSLLLLSGLMLLGFVGVTRTGRHGTGRQA